ncbi:hypothetical protein NQ314_002311 [Rhamnusium bicolor]|uniref:Chitin-binding type-2 domain-containing protein n=1 Tax=Rhamnusium bicolor TaxID=1586634 RepID=A0AAV8ZQA2_9CUCU|nr:hypothetical protein NQ314_002311 [Rhamnusium bicolor]
MRYPAAVRKISQFKQSLPNDDFSSNFGVCVFFDPQRGSLSHCPAVDGILPKYLPHKDCSKFWECSNGIPHQFGCPDGLHFNSDLNVCDWPEQAGCSGKDVGDNNESDKNEKCKQFEHYCPAIERDRPVYIPLPNCSQFCQCSNGKPYLHDCPDGLHFNSVLNVCNWPEDAHCSEGNVTEGSSESSTESNNSGTESNNSGEESDGNSGEDDDEGYDEDNNGNNNVNETCREAGIDCPAVDRYHIVYFPQLNCSQFCQCSNGKAYLRDCPDGLHFNLVLNVCDWPEEAGCSNSNITEGTSESSTDSNNNSEGGDGNIGEGGGEGNNEGNVEDEDDNENAVVNQICLEADIGCPAIDGDHPAYIPLLNCSQFCQCSNGKAYLRDCPDGLHFNPVLNVCDWPEEAGCSNSNITEGTSESSTDSNNNSEGGDGNIGEGGGEGNNEGNVEDEDDNENAVVNQICLEADIGCPAIDGDHPTYIPLLNCSQFCQCSNGKAYLRDCPDGLHFNPVLNVCDWPEEARCSNSNITEGTSESSTDSNNNSEGSEGNIGEGGGEGNDEGNVEDEDHNENAVVSQICLEADIGCPAIDGDHPVYIPLLDCSQFCQCSNGKAYLRNCPDGLHFNPILNVCDWPENAGCSGGNNTEGTSESSTESNNSGESSDVSSSEDDDEDEGTDGNNNGNDINQTCLEGGIGCPDEDGDYPVYVPLPNCTQFCQCSNGKLLLLSCPNGLHFNSLSNVCDRPEVAQCGEIYPS